MKHADINVNMWYNMQIENGVSPESLAVVFSWALPLCCLQFRQPRQLLHRLSGSLIHEQRESSSKRSLSSKENLSTSPSQSNTKSMFGRIVEGGFWQRHLRLVGVTPDLIMCLKSVQRKLTAGTCRLFFAPFSYEYTAWMPTNWLYRVPGLFHYAFTWSYLLLNVILGCLSQNTRPYLQNLLRLTITNTVGKVRRCPVIIEISQVRTQVSRVLSYSSHKKVGIVCVYHLKEIH